VINAEQLLRWGQFFREDIKPRPYVRGHQQRMGKHNTERLSQYRVLKEYHWPAAYKTLLADHLPELVPREATHWVLYFDKGDFLDEQDAWVDCRTPVEFFMVALLPKQQIKVDGYLHSLSAGDAIQFAPSYRHEVPVTSREAAWLGFMVFRAGPTAKTARTSNETHIDEATHGDNS
jgi:hypothetical protein